MPPKRKPDPPDKPTGANCTQEKTPYRTIKTSLKSVIKNPARDKNSCLNMLGIMKHMIYNKNKRPMEFIRG